MVMVGGVKPETLREIQLSYKSTKLPKPKRKNTKSYCGVKEGFKFKKKFTFVFRFCAAKLDG